MLLHKWLGGKNRNGYVKKKKQLFNYEHFMVLLRYQNPAACLTNTAFLNVACADFLPFSTFLFLGNLKTAGQFGDKH